jgi:putative transposase
MAKPRKYTREEAEAALAKVKEIGFTAALKELPMSKSTLANWLRDSRLVAVEADAPSAPPKTESAPVKATKVAKSYTPSFKSQVLEYAAANGATEAARHFSISRFSVYEWQRRSQQEAQGETPESKPQVATDGLSRDERILQEWRTHPGLGPSQVRNQLRRKGFKVSVHTVRCVLDENGYVTPKVRRKEVHDRRYEASRPNQLWHLDFLHRHINKQKIFVLLLIDDYSRFIVGGAIVDGERVDAVCEVFSNSVTRHGRPEKAMSDGGSAFYSWRGIGQFTRLLDEMEIDQLIARTPEVNGKLEVLNANIQKELFNSDKFFDLRETQLRFSAWVEFYNLRRTHHALGGVLVPADRYFGRSEEVLALVQQGQNPAGVGEAAAPADRHLDLLRVTSHRGQLELHLLGHRIQLPSTVAR